MEKYQGTKIVQAEPMDEHEAIQKGFARANTDGHEMRKGFHVVYPDGYQSWSPREVFTEAYKPCGSFEDRICIEREELWEKMKKLAAFVDSDKFKTLSFEDQKLLNAQLCSMTSYYHILDLRYIRLLPQCPG